MRILSAVLFLPLLGGLTLVLIPRRRPDLLMGGGLLVSLATFALSLPLYFRFDGDVPDYQFVEYAVWMPSLGVGYYLGIVLGYGLVGVYVSSIFDAVFRGLLNFHRFQHAPWLRSAEKPAPAAPAVVGDD